jgi:hypothetical protein
LKCTHNLGLESAPNFRWQYSLEFLGVGQKISVILADTRGMVDLEKQDFSIQISYSDSASEIFKEELIRFNLYDPSISNQSPYNDDMTNALEKISRQLENINTSGIRVDTDIAKELALYDFGKKLQESTEK